MISDIKTVIPEHNIFFFFELVGTRRYFEILKYKINPLASDPDV